MIPYRTLVTWWAQELLIQEPIHTGEVHARKLPHDEMFSMYELLYRTLRYKIPLDMDDLAQEIKPNVPWAEEHFQERVSGTPYNPAPSHVRWPWARHNAQHQGPQEQFSHTYPERFWPKMAGRQDWKTEGPVDPKSWEHYGIRYPYGDLGDVVSQLQRNPATRQAFLPVWFPEDTGATDRRVPCSIGYHFMIRGGDLHVAYTIRSCDLIRHFADDVYMACRLAQWMCGQVGAEPGNLTMHIHSLHAFVGDRFALRRIVDAANA